MSEGERKSKGTDPPLCKVCEHRHWLRDPHIWSSRSTGTSPALAKAKAVVASPPKTKRKNGKKRDAPKKL